MPGDPQKNIFAIIAITLVFVLLAMLILFIAILHKRKVRSMDIEKNQLEDEYKKMLLQTQVEMQEATFASLGKELHDNVGQLLGTAKMLIGVSQRNLSTAGDTIRTADETLGKAIHELRSLSKTLNKEWLEQFNLKENIHTEAERINSAGILKVRVQDENTFLVLGSEEQLILFRIVQEAVQNSVKHSGANEINISIKEEKDELLIFIADNGIGFTQTIKPSGVGILNMKQRINLLKGFIEWSHQQKGTVVSIRLPNKGKNL